jgi:hypothetical protein
MKPIIGILIVLASFCVHADDYNDRAAAQLQQRVERWNQIGEMVQQSYISHVSAFAAKFSTRHGGWSGCQPIHASGIVIGCDFKTGDDLACSGVVTGPMSGNYVQLKCIDRALKTHVFRSGTVRL